MWPWCAPKPCSQITWRTSTEWQRTAAVAPGPIGSAVDPWCEDQNEQRRDDLHRYEIELEKGLLENVSTSLKYTYYKEHSNVAVFDYDREILGWYVTYRFRM